MDKLSLNWVVLDSLLESLNWLVLSKFLLIDLGNVLSLIFDGVVVGILTFMRDLDSLSDLLVFHNGALIRDVPWEGNFFEFY